MIHHKEMSAASLRKAIKQGSICLGGNSKLQIYGTLTCASGKRMKREHRVFFSCETEALYKGYRPCGQCMKTEYLKWKNGVV